MTTTYDDHHAVSIIWTGPPDHPTYTLQWREIGPSGELGSPTDEGKYTFRSDDLVEAAHVALLAALRRGGASWRSAFEAGLPTVLVNVALARAHRPAVAAVPLNTPNPYAHARSPSARTDAAETFVSALAARLSAGDALDNDAVAASWREALALL